MAVYPVCEKCRLRRDKCAEPVLHKRFTAWVADWKPSRVEPRLRKTYGSDIENPKELADIQLRQWKTDRERGVLQLKDGKAISLSFADLADEWWTKVVIGKSQIKDPRRSEWSRVEKLKRVFGTKLVAETVPESDRHRYLTLEDVEAWIVERREAEIMAGTINRDLKPLQWILKFAIERRYLKSNPIASLKRVKGERIHDRWMTEEEISALIQAAYDLNDTDLVEFIAIGVNTGFRLGNLERLTARDVDGSLLLARQTKSGTPYSVPITSAIELLLRRLVQQHPTGPLLNTVEIGPRFRAAARKAGLYSDSRDNERVTIHTLRHTYAVLYLKRGGDIYKLSKLLGHASVAITDKIYARFCPKDKLIQAPLISTPIAGIEQPQLKVV